MTTIDKVDAAFEAALDNWQIRNLTMIDTPFVAGIIEGLREQVKEILANVTLTEDCTELD
jgi:hypothetical protein